MTDIQPVLSRADQNLSSSLEKLFELLRIQSISTDPAYKAECRKAAEWLVAYLQGLGFEASVRKQLLAESGIEVGGGLGKLAGQIWRVGLMGENARVVHVEALLFALQRALR